MLPKHVSVQASTVTSGKGGFQFCYLLGVASFAELPHLPRPGSGVVGVFVVMHAAAAGGYNARSLPSSETDLEGDIERLMSLFYLIRRML